MSELSRKRRLAILSICCTSLLIVGLDVTAVNVALPSIGRNLHAGISGLQWTVDAYTLVLASLLMLSGSSGDRFGRRRVFMTGLLLFLGGSVLCSVATSVAMLVSFRVIQAVGGSMLNPVAMSIIANTFTDPRERAQAVGVWGGVAGISIALGPVIGGALASAVSWRAIFLLNVPIGLIGLALTWRFVPESRAPVARRFDPAGQALVITFVAALTFAIIEAPSHGWDSPTIVIALALAGLGIAGLLAVEPRREQPLLDLRFFRSVPFSAAVLTAICAFIAFGGFLFLNTLYLQRVRGLSPVDAGLYTLPLALAAMLVSPYVGRFVGRHGPRWPLLVSGSAYAVACGSLANLSAHTAPLLLLGSYVVFGIGFGAVNAPVTNAAVSGMPRAQAGVAAATASTARQFGQTLGVAIAGAIISSTAGLRARGLAEASHPAWWAMLGCGLAIVMLGLVATGERAKLTAQRAALALNPEALSTHPEALAA